MCATLARGDVEATRSLRAPRCQIDPEAAFEDVFLNHYPRVLAILMRLVADRGQAEELVNEVFWKLSNQRPKIVLSENVGAWLYRTATHTGIDAIRSTTRRKRYEEAAAVQGGLDPSPQPGPLQNVLREEDRRRVRSVLASMKSAQAQILLMRASGASYKELASALGVAETGIGTLLNRAEAEFRKRYLEESL
jgi:RNA polymerase sigma-70 factor (ECF subfamily)